MDPREPRSRRQFLSNSLAGLGSVALAPGAGTMPAAPQAGPAEDMVREHGMLRRIMPAYRACSGRMASGKTGGRAESRHRAARPLRRFGEGFRPIGFEEAIAKIGAIEQALDIELSRFAPKNRG